MPAWPTQNFDTMRIATVPFVAASTALADAVADYDSIKFKNSVLAAATFHLAYCKSKLLYTMLAIDAILTLFSKK